MHSVDDLEVLGRRVLLRSDLNVPLDLTGTGEITDDGRIRASLPVISKLSDRGARVSVLAHLGRPKGDSFAERAAGGPSLRPVVERLGELLGRPVAFATDVAGDSASKTAFSLGDEDVAVLENVRFEPAETSKDDAERGAFAQQLARFGELYVDDAFGAVHRKHASVYDLPALLPHAAGDLVRDEVSVLRQLTTDPARPFVVVLGGKKPSDKLAVIRNVYPMPPPMRMRSARLSRCPITASLSDGFLPPSTTTNGRAGSVVSRRSTATSASTRSPAACGSSPGRS